MSAQADLLRVASEITDKAIVVANRIAAALDAAPHVAPVPGGGVQFEWKDMEIEIRANGDVSIIVDGD
jgi:hypothetical protein